LGDINGEKETGVTTFKLQHEIDTGDILLSEVIPITDEETAGELHDKMKEVGAELLLKTLQGLAAGDLEEKPQPATNSSLKHAPKIFSETCNIDWNKTTAEVYNLVRGLSPLPCGLYIFRRKKIENI
jgi:methionyl-tRNA formyltransferase